MNDQLCYIFFKYVHTWALQNDDNIKFIMFRIFCSYYMKFITELETRNASLALYQYLCHNIVGTEDHVKQIRLMNTVKDNLSHSNISAKITSGSFGEGLQMRGSDLDIMVISNDMEVLACEDPHIVFNLNKTYFATDQGETQPGFIRLRVVRSNCHDIRKFCEQRGRYFYFSSTAFKQALSTYSLPIIHGPCVSDKTGFYDFAIAVHAQSWTEPALKWLTRSNNGWPGNDVKQTIVQDGVLFVPNSLSKCTSEKMQPLKKLTHKHYELLNLNLFRKMDIVQLWKVFLVDHVVSIANSTLIPIELQIEVNSEIGRIPPVVYAHFLCFLCHYHLNNTRKCRESLQDLKLTVDEKYVMVDLIDEVLSYSILGKSFQLIGDIESANWAYLQSKELKIVISRDLSRVRH
ncbi:unnamed protein product [Mytilus coruscus]|uniref:Mab-21-like nucleotidyltransferase domain-containing protein n=1 Tax=Mytilus coruscus TaxID=42192 RepID=A0A6J8BYY7_MYTCO|nr:unnamed protein product [Mytilus coruscus]